MRVRPENPMVGIFLSFEDVFPGEPNTRELFLSELATFDPDDLLQVEAKINYVLSAGAYNSRNTIQLEVAGTLGKDAILGRMVQQWQSGERDVLFTRHQVLAMMAESLMLNQAVGSKLVHQDLPAFRKPLIRMAGLLGTSIDQAADRQARDIKAEFFRNIMLNEEQDMDVLMGRYYQLFFRCFPQAMRKYRKEAYDLVAAFKRKTGIHLKVFLVSALGVWSHYANQRTPAERFKFIHNTANFLLSVGFSSLPVRSRPQARAAITLLTGRRADLREMSTTRMTQSGGLNYYVLSTLWERPLYGLNEDTVFPLDMAFLQDRMTNGVKWIVHESITRAIALAGSKEEKKVLSKERIALLSFYGRPLELYAELLLKRMHEKWRGVTIRANLDDRPGADFVIYDPRVPNAVVVIELTASTVPYGVAMSGDLEAINRELRKIFFKTEGKKSRGKIPQLNETIKALKAGRVPGIPGNRITEIYPVLLQEKGLPWVPGIVSHYKQLIQEDGITDTAFERFQIMDLEELERVEVLVAKRGMVISDLLHKKYNSEYRPCPVKNFLLSNELWIRNERVSAQWNRILWDGGLIFGYGPKQLLEFCKVQLKHILKK